MLTPITGEGVAVLVVVAVVLAWMVWPRRARTDEYLSPGWRAPKGPDDV
jgi:hypothetical protein